MSALRVDSLPEYYTGVDTVNENDKPEILWIRTSEAAKILGVKSTEGVLVIVRGKDRENPNWIVRYLNVGTNEKPRYMLSKADVLKLAKERKS